MSRLIGEKLTELLRPPSGIVDSLFRAITKNADVELVIKIPEYDYLRAEVFVEDIRELSGARFFDLGNVINLLYEDFILQVREATTPLPQMIAYLKERRSLITREMKVRELKPIAPNHWHSEENTIVQRRKTVSLRITIPRKTALRGEVLLRDMNELDREFSMTLEGLVALLLLDLLSEVKRGNGRKFITGIIARLETERL